jgi:hypothetical protein
VRDVVRLWRGRQGHLHAAERHSGGRVQVKGADVGMKE